MVGNCVVFGCVGTRPGENISLHEFPLDKQRRGTWRRFVQTTRKLWAPTKHSQICSQHFVPTDFKNWTKYQMKFAKRLTLNSTAVPTIHPDRPGPGPTSTAAAGAGPSTSTAAGPPKHAGSTRAVPSVRPAVRKREIHRDKKLVTNETTSATAEENHQLQESITSETASAAVEEENGWKLFGHTPKEDPDVIMDPEVIVKEELDLDIVKEEYFDSC